MASPKFKEYKIGLTKIKTLAPPMHLVNFRKLLKYQLPLLGFSQLKFALVGITSRNYLDIVHMGPK